MLLLLTSLATAAPIAEAWVSAPTPAERAQLHSLGIGFAEGQRGDQYRMHGSLEQLQALSAQGWRVTGLRPDHRQPVSPPLVAEPYPTPEQLNEQLRQLQAEHPERTQLRRIGRSVQGRPLLALQLGDPDLPAWRVLGAHHGDEPPSAVVAVELARQLLLRQPPFQDTLDQVQLWVVPTVNPDGLAAGTRYNANDVDLNRNYDFHWSEETFAGGPEPFSEPETRAVRALATQTRFVAGLSLHTGAANIGWVYNYSLDDTIEEDRLQRMAQAYEGRCTQTGFYSTQGAEWYVTYGDETDWSFGRNGVLDFTLELHEQKSPPVSTMTALFNAHAESIAELLAAPVGLQGQVLDASTGRPIDARLTVEGQTGQFASDPVTGRFARLLEPGSYVVEVVAAGYHGRRLRVSANGGPAQLDLALWPDGRDTIRPSPAWVASDAAPQVLQLPGAGPLPGQLHMTRAGFADVELPALASGFLLTPGELAPGAWTIQADRLVLPRALLVSDRGGHVLLEQATHVGDQLHIEGQGFALGTRAFAIFGPDRALQPLPILSGDAQSLRADASGLPEGGTFDLLVVSDGSEQAIPDLSVFELPDSANPGDTAPDDSSQPGPSETTRAGYQGCLHSQGTGPWPLLLIPLLVRRRSWHRESPSSS